MRRWNYSKGHGTGNDFVVLLDRESLTELTAEDARFLCDRHFGIGADGVLRAVLARHIPEWTGDGSLWFMDYRNADGSIAEMCGNGVRVFVRYLLEAGLVSGPDVPVATRAGLRMATVQPDGRIRVAMGPVSVADDDAEIRTVDGGIHRGRPADVGNPHAVVFVDDLGPLPLHAAPTWSPADRFPDGVNIEFVRRRGRDHVAMRVFERGVGETLSCGTGTVAAAAVTRVLDDRPLPALYRVDVAGGTVEVELTAEQAYLTGPAIVVAHGEVTLAPSS